MNLHHRDRRSGITGVWVALMGSLMVVFLGLAVDTTYVVRTIDELQTAADAAALAGAAQVKTDISVGRLAAQSLAAANTAGMTDGVRDEVVLDLNPANLATGDIVTGRWYRWDDDTTDPPHSGGDFDAGAAVGVNAVKVVARRTETSLGGSLPLLFGPLFGWNTVDLEMDAVALITGSTGAGIIVLCEDCECSLRFGGTTELTLSTTADYDGDASIQVNSDATGCSPNNAAVCGGGSSLIIDAPEINIHAKGPETSCWNGDISVPPLNPGSPRIPDPLAGLPEPDYLSMPDYGCISSGAGCDTRLCITGPDTGLACQNDGQCSDTAGTCEATSLVCNGGPSGGLACFADVDCATPTSCDLVSLTCTGGPNDGGVCSNAADCPTWSCSTNVWTCTSGSFVGQPCTNAGGECIEAGDCANEIFACVGGSDDGFHCDSGDDCPGGLCGVAPTLCHQGDNADAVCTSDDDCPSGTCVTTVRMHPGYYSGGFRIINDWLKLVLDTGVYSLDNADGGPGAGLVINGGHLDASAGVMLHIVGDGVVDLAGNGSMVIGPIETEGHLYEGVSLFQSRTNFSEARVIGGDTLILDGTYYFPNNPVEIGGEGIAVGNQLIAYTLYLHGTGTYTINYDGRNPAPGYKIFLVE